MGENCSLGHIRGFCLQYLKWPLEKNAYSILIIIPPYLAHTLHTQSDMEGVFLGPWETRRVGTRCFENFVWICSNGRKKITVICWINDKSSDWYACGRAVCVCVCACVAMGVDLFLKRCRCFQRIVFFFSPRSDLFFCPVIPVRESQWRLQVCP